MNLCDYLGIELEYLVWGLAGVVVLLLLLLLINMCMIGKLKKKYKKFMGDTDAKSLEEKIEERLEQLNDLVESHYTNKSKIEKLENQMNVTFQKIGLVKYDAFNEMGGKLSFSLALLNEKNDGFRRRPPQLAKDLFSCKRYKVLLLIPQTRKYCPGARG